MFSVVTLEHWIINLILCGQTELSYCVMHVDLTGILLLDAKTAGKTR